MQHSRRAAVWAAIAGVLTYVVVVNLVQRGAWALLGALGAGVPVALFVLSYPLALIVAALVAFRVRDRVR